MKKLLVLFLLLTVVACQSGEFTPKRHQMHEMGRADCTQTPEKCVDGYPW